MELRELDNITCWSGYLLVTRASGIVPQSNVYLIWQDMEGAAGKNSSAMAVTPPLSPIAQ